MSYASADDWLRIVQDFHSRAKASNKRLVIVTSAQPRVIAIRRVLAARDAGFGVAVTTLHNWAESLWSLFGDGTTPLDAGERKIVAKRAWSETTTEKLTDGMLDLLCRAATEALPFADNMEPLSDNEKEVARVLLAYRKLLKEAGKIEYSDILHEIGGTPAIETYLPIVMAEPDDFSALEQHLLGGMNAIYLHRALNVPDEEARADELQDLLATLFNRKPGSNPVASTGAVRIALASGPQAQNRCVEQAIENALSEGCRTVNMVLPDPLAQFRYSAPLLERLSASCAVRARKAFSDTDAGRALLDVCTMTGPDQPDLMLDADYAFSPFAGIWYGTAFFTDKTHRGNRLIDNSEVLTDLAGHAADGLQGVIGLVEEDDVLGAIELLTRWAASHFAFDEGYLAEQLAALSAAQTACQAASDWNASQREAILDLQESTIAVKATTTVQESAEPSSDDSHAKPLITFLTLRDAAQTAPASVDAVVIGQLNAADYSLKQADDSLATLLAKWGIAQKPDVWGHARREFYAAVQSARKSIVLQRTTHNETADEAQAAAVFEEALACYQLEPTDSSDIDRIWGIPKSLVPYASLCGEEKLVENATGSEPDDPQQLGAPTIGAITPEAQRFIVLPRNYKGATYPGMDLSASQIESYLECPYQWFAKRRLKLETIDEQFSPVERGTFMHSILEHFYERFQLEVAPKVTADLLPQARQIMTEVFHEQAKRQFTDPKLKKGSRYVPVNAMEEKQRDKLLDQLISYLDYEATLLPAFRPWKFEWAYGNLRPFSYAGCNLVGRIDRIDMNDAGDTVVIDYKSSLSNAYRLHLDPQGKEAKAQIAQQEADRKAYRAENGGLEPPAEEPVLELPSKMQALIYAKVVRDELNCNVVASIYLNPLTGTIQGAYDERRIGRDQLPFAKEADMRAAAVPYQSIRTFDQLIDECEQVVGARMDRLRQGVIAPAPHGQDACTYCPVGNCPKRLAKRSL